MVSSLLSRHRISLVAIQILLLALSALSISYILLLMSCWCVGIEEASQSTRHCHCNFAIILYLSNNIYFILHLTSNTTMTDDCFLRIAILDISSHPRKARWYRFVLFVMASQPQLLLLEQEPRSHDNQHEHEIHSKSGRNCFAFIVVFKEGFHFGAYSVAKVPVTE